MSPIPPFAKEHFSVSRFRRAENIPSLSTHIFQVLQGWKYKPDGFGSLRVVEGDPPTPPSVHSSKILHTLSLTVEEEYYFHFNQEI